MSSFFGGNKIARMKLLSLPNGIILKDLFLVWNIYPCDCQFIGPRLREWTATGLNQSWILSFIFCHFIKTEVCHSTSRSASKQNLRWSDMDLDELLHVLGSILSMEVIETHGT